MNKKEFVKFCLFIVCPFIMLMFALIEMILTENSSLFAIGIVFIVGWYTCVGFYLFMKKHHKI